MLSQASGETPTSQRNNYVAESLSAIYVSRLDFRTLDSSRIPTHRPSKTKMICLFTPAWMLFSPIPVYLHEWLPTRVAPLATRDTGTSILPQNLTISDCLASVNSLPTLQCFPLLLEKDVPIRLEDWRLPPSTHSRGAPLTVPCNLSQFVPIKHTLRFGNSHPYLTHLSLIHI